jgi:hypothetical protein
MFAGALRSNLSQRRPVSGDEQDIKAAGGELESQSFADAG